MDTKVTAQSLNDGDVIVPTPYNPPKAINTLPRMQLPWLRLVLISLSLLAIFAAWFVTSANTVEFVTRPQDATVEVKALLAPKVGEKWILRPGPHHVIANSSGYHQFNEEVIITDEAMQKHVVELTPLPGHLRIEVSPVPNAQLILDGETTDDAPTTLRDLPAGLHHLQIVAERYKAFETPIEIEGKDIEQTLSVELQPAWADASFDSSPQGAAVLVDGEAIGATPLSAELLEGSRKVEVNLKGYKPWRRTFPVIAGEDLNVPRILLQKADGVITVSSTPSKATITVDGEYKGKTPLSINVPPDKTLTVRAIKPGYTPASKKITVESGETDKLALNLAAELAQVRFIITPEDAEVTINGEKQAQANQVIQLPTHEHKVEIRKPGFKSYQAAITPRKGVEKRIRVRLRPGSGDETVEAAASGNTSSTSTQPADSDGNTIRTFSEQQLRLFNGGTVSMGSSRRDPARQANEVLRSASLKRPFYISIKEVTNGEFRQFLANHVSRSDSGQNVNDENQPVVNVSWNTAALYCNWLSRKDSLDVFYQIKSGRVLGINPAALGYRLPSEAEWALVARMQNGETIKYPWAGKYPPRGRSGNYADESAAGVLAPIINEYNDGFVASAPVGSFPANLNGIYDLGGNVSEWVHDFYVAAPQNNVVDPLGPRTGQQHVIRGSSWTHSGDRELRFSYRDHGNDARHDLGFRIARYAR